MNYDIGWQSKLIKVLHRDANVDGDDGHDDVENKRGESARELPLFTVLSGFSANGVEFRDLPPPE